MDNSILSIQSNLNVIGAGHGPSDVAFEKQHTVAATFPENSVLRNVSIHAECTHKYADE